MTTLLDDPLPKGKTKVLVVGGESSIALEYQSLLCNVDAYVTTKKGTRGFDLDLSAPENIDPKLLQIEFDVAIVFAAMTNIAECENKPDLAKAINCDAIVSLHKALNVKHWILLSTNAVFSGEQEAAAIDTPHSPFNFYGKSKADMENYFLQYMCTSSIVRLTKVVTPRFTFFEELLKKVRAGNNVEVFKNMVLSPVSISQVADFLIALTVNPIGGIYQLSGKQDTTYYEVAKYLIENERGDQNLLIPSICTNSVPRFTSLAVGKREWNYGFTSEPIYKLLGNCTEVNK
jgi:dTDP-4-dehydrorhamnose reductase